MPLAQWLALSCLLPIIYKAYFKKELGDGNSKNTIWNEANLTFTSPVIILALLVIFFGIAVMIPGSPYSLVSSAVNLLAH